MSLCKVTGTFLAPSATGETLEPLTGSVTLRSSAPVILTSTASVAGTVEVVCVVNNEGVLTYNGTPGVTLIAPGDGVQPEGFTYEAIFNLSTSEGSAYKPSFYFAPVPGGEVDLATVTPTPSSSGSFTTVSGGTAGKDGRGVVSILDDDGDGTATVTYSDGSTSALTLPTGMQGFQGTSVDSLTLNQTASDTYDLTYELSNGDRGSAGQITVHAGEAGAPGKDGRGITSITDTDGDGIATISYSDGTSESLNLPRGEGGSSETVQDTGWRDITSLASNGTLTPFASNRLFLRRVGNLVTLNVHEYGFTTSGTNGNWLVMPNGFKYSTGHPTQQRITAFVNPIGINTPAGQVYCYNTATLGFQSFRGQTGYAYIQWLTDDGYPALLPGNAV